MPRCREATIYAGRPISAPAVAKPQHDGSFRTQIVAFVGRSDTNQMRRRGTKSFVDDLVLSRGVVLSRAVLFCDLLRLSPLTRRFVRFRRTRLRHVGVVVVVVAVGRSVGRSIDRKIERTIGCFNYAPVRQKCRPTRRARNEHKCLLKNADLLVQMPTYSCNTKSKHDKTTADASPTFIESSCFNYVPALSD